MLINFTNHASERWGEEQMGAAQKLYGQVVDLPFPAVPTDADTAVVLEMADSQIRRIEALFTKASDSGLPRAVLCQGEFTLAFAVIARLLEKGITAVCAVSERNVRETQAGGETRKEVVFRFAGFREYHA